MNEAKLLELITKIDKLFALGQAVAKYANAHKAITKREFPDQLPPDLDVDFEKILEDDEDLKI